MKFGKVTGVFACFLIPLLAPAGDLTRFPPADAPALAELGPHGSGVMRLTLVDSGRPDPLAEVAGTPADRVLDAVLWYPTHNSGAKQAGAFYPVPSPQGSIPNLPARIEVAGRAVRDAVPVADGGFPLVVLSHGYQNWATIFAYLGEALASRGYVVASIEHRDEEPGPDGVFERSFHSTVLNRTRDQRFVIAELTRRARAEGDVLYGLFDPTRVALAGYSMGGFGALATVGAGYSPQSPIYASLGNLLDPLTHGSPEITGGVPENVRALIALAPWGGAPRSRAWESLALAEIRIPSLFISGDLDDVSDFENGVKWIFESMTESERIMLVYLNARHNVAVGPVPEALAEYFEFRERFDEPVWRKDRTMAINTHFIGAFLDLHLKGDATAERYLSMPTVNADAGIWPLVEGQSAGESFAGGEGASAGYWPGFRRRWAVGLELHKLQNSSRSD